VDPAWEARLERGGPEISRLLAELRPLVAHASLLQFIEAYSVVFDLLARLPAGEGMDEADCVNRAIKEGKQAYLQRRITSEASIGKILFGNGFKLAANLGLTAAGPDLRAERIRLLREFKELSRRMDRIRLMAMADEWIRTPRSNSKDETHAAT
jgi:glycerol-3-phosphate O-acyltransferase